MSGWPMPTTPAFTAPPGACDCHTHIFSPGAPTEGAPAYPLPAAPFAAHRAVLEAVGLARGVIVQPSAYGSDHRVLVDALARSKGRLRGVALLDGDSDEAEFDRLDAAGVTAVRFVEARVPGTGARYPGNVAIAQLDALRPRLAARAWHAEVWASLTDAAAICDEHGGRGVPIVLDHLAGASAETDPDDPDFRRVLRHVAAGAVWVKLVLCRTARRLEDALPARRLQDALIAANPARLVWGTDFPFIRKGEDAPDVARLLDLIADWAGPHAGAILSANPAALYRFPTIED
ncbi:2-pyrone-4,6-dicarboxylate hydrolase [Sphingomonas gilva]|uniref:2-pyrone-4,6-dicarboxylate hydrolase n=1 Tax=Sphingomonas gilva TaxID=2305907 RepID=A0A396RZS0_9SPHN|nr:amidohydrolase family protein [Sphingomonas gilva]RHW19241.1 2-pyrone-4,6-dicarboxylate hydrolase [Sphingomonas gilva]